MITRPVLVSVRIVSRTLLHGSWFGSGAAQKPWSVFSKRPDRLDFDHLSHSMHTTTGHRKRIEQQKCTLVYVASQYAQIMLCQRFHSRVVFSCFHVDWDPQFWNVDGFGIALCPDACCTQLYACDQHKCNLVISIYTWAISDGWFRWYFCDMLTLFYEVLLNSRL